mgnify:FL=1
MEKAMRILGIDPGYAIMGYGLIDKIGNSFKPVDYGVIKTKAGELLPERLLKIRMELSSIVEKYRPDEMAVEELFFNTNSKTVIHVAESRGVALVEGAVRGINVNEYTPLQVKQGVVGYGRAQKVQVMQMVKVLLNLESVPKPDDAADALAVAICHANSGRKLI